MKLVRFGDPGDERPGMVDRQGRIRDLSGHVSDIAPDTRNGNTKTMIFDVATLVSYVSQFMSLQPGDVISTGTPPGVGMGQKPEPVSLHPGQTMRLGIAGLGEQHQRTVQARIEEAL